MGRARDIANIINSGTFITPASASTTYSTLGNEGLVKIIPGSISNTSGTSSVSSSGLVTYTNVGTISLNDVFSSTYDNYRIVINGGVHSTTSNLILRYRYGTTDDSQNVYYLQYSQVRQDGASDIGAFNPTTGFVIAVGGSGVDPLVIVERQLARITGYAFNQSSNGSFGHRSFSGKHNNMNQTYHGFTLTASTGTISGTVKIYGYKN
jgi:hypothetical protein